MKKTLLLLSSASLFINQYASGVCTKDKCGTSSNTPYPYHQSEEDHYYYTHFNQDKQGPFEVSMSEQDEFTNEKDQELLKSLRQNLNMNPNVSNIRNIKISVDNGKVTLEGWVKNSKEKESISQQIKNMKRVVKFDNNLSIQSDSKDSNGSKESNSSNYFSNGRNQNNINENSTNSNSDEQMQRNIDRELRRNGFSTRNLTIDISNGNVTLSGYVGNDRNKADIEQKVKNVAGVRRVINQLKVQSNDPNRNW